MSPPDPNEAFTAALRQIGRGFGIVVLVAPSIWLGRTWWFVHHAVTTSGVILKVELSSGGKTRGHYPSYEFTDESGVIHQQRSSYPCDANALHAGDRIEVIFDRQNPDRSAINTFDQIWSVPVVVTCWFLLLGTFLLWNNRKRRKDIPPR